MSHVDPIWKRRKPWNTPGQSHSLTFSTYQRRAVLTLPGVADVFLDCLNKARHETQFLLHAYVVMPDHCHVVLRPTQETYSMSAILTAIKTPSAKAIFELHPELRDQMQVYRPSRGFEARFWQQGGGFDRNISDIDARRAMMDYIHRNPVRAGLCQDLDSWRWSSYSAYNGGAPPIPVDMPDWM
jgi:putative transposase